MCKTSVQNHFLFLGSKPCSFICKLTSLRTSHETESLSILSIIYHFTLITSTCRWRRYISCNVGSRFQFYLTPEPWRHSPKITWPTPNLVFLTIFTIFICDILLYPRTRENLAAIVSTQYCKWFSFVVPNFCLKWLLPLNININFVFCFSVSSVVKHQWGLWNFFKCFQSKNWNIT